MKKVAIKKAASQEMPRDIELEPGTTAYDALKALGLESNEYGISTPSGEILEGHDALYNKVEDGDKLLITERASVGTFQ